MARPRNRNLDSQTQRNRDVGQKPGDSDDIGDIGDPGDIGDISDPNDGTFDDNILLPPDQQPARPTPPPPKPETPVEHRERLYREYIERERERERQAGLGGTAQPGGGVSGPEQPQGATYEDTDYLTGDQEKPAEQAFGSKPSGSAHADRDLFDTGDFDALPVDSPSDDFSFDGDAVESSEASTDHPVNEQGQRVHQLPSGEWVLWETFSALTLEEQRLIAELGVEGFNAEMERQRSESPKTSDGQPLHRTSTGEYILQSDYDALPAEHQEIVNRLGVAGYQQEMERQRSESPKTPDGQPLHRTSTGEYILQSDYDALPAEHQEIVNRLGVAGYQQEIESRQQKQTEDWVNQIPTEGGLRDRLADAGREGGAAAIEEEIDDLKDDPIRFEASAETLRQAREPDSGTRHNDYIQLTYERGMAAVRAAEAKRQITGADVFGTVTNRNGKQINFRYDPERQNFIDVDSGRIVHPVTGFYTGPLQGQSLDAIEARNKPSTRPQRFAWSDDARAAALEQARASGLVADTERLSSTDLLRIKSAAEAGDYTPQDAEGQELHRTSQGELLRLKDYQGLTSDQQALIDRIGVSAFNERPPVDTVGDPRGVEADSGPDAETAQTFEDALAQERDATDTTSAPVDADGQPLHRLPTGEHVLKSEYDAMPADDRARLDRLGAAAYNEAAATSGQPRVLPDVLTQRESAPAAGSGPVDEAGQPLHRLSTGDHVLKSEYDALPADARAKLDRLGIKDYNEDEASTGSPLMLTESQRRVLDTGGLDGLAEYDNIIAHEGEASTGSPLMLTESQRRVLDTGGLDGLAEYDNIIAHEGGTGVDLHVPGPVDEAGQPLHRLSTGDHVLKSEYDALPADARAKLDRLGIKDYNEDEASTGSPLMLTESQRRVLDTGGLDGLAEYDNIIAHEGEASTGSPLMLTESQRRVLDTGGLDGLAEYDNIIAHEGGTGVDLHVPGPVDEAGQPLHRLSTGDHVLKSEYDALPADARAKLDRLGIEGYNESRGIDSSGERDSVPLVGDSIGLHESGRVEGADTASRKDEGIGKYVDAALSAAGPGISPGLKMIYRFGRDRTTPENMKQLDLGPVDDFTRAVIRTAPRALPGMAGRQDMGPVGDLFDKAAGAVPHSIQMTGSNPAEQAAHLAGDLILPGYEQQRKWEHTSPTEKAIIGAADALTFVPVVGKVGGAAVKGAFKSVAQATSKGAGRLLNAPVTQTALQHLAREKRLTDLFASGRLTDPAVDAAKAVRDIEALAAWDALAAGRKQAVDVAATPTLTKPVQGGLFPTLTQQAQTRLGLVRDAAATTTQQAQTRLGLLRDAAATHWRTEKNLTDLWASGKLTDPTADRARLLVLAEATAQGPPARTLGDAWELAGKGRTQPKVGKVSDADYFDTAFELQQRGDAIQSAEFYSEFAERMAKKADKPTPPAGGSPVVGLDDVMRQADDVLAASRSRTSLPAAPSRSPVASLDDAVRQTDEGGVAVASSELDELLGRASSRQQQQQYLDKTIEAVNARHELAVARQGVEAAQKRLDDLTGAGADASDIAAAGRGLGAAQAAAAAAARTTSQTETRLDMAVEHDLWTPSATGAQPLTGAQVTAGTRPAVDARTEAEALTGAQPAAETRPAVDARTEAEALTGAQPAAETRPAVDARTETSARAATEASALTGAQPVAETRPAVDALTEALTGAQPAVETRPAVDARTETSARAATEAEARTRIKPVTDIHAVTRPQPVVDTSAVTQAQPTTSLSPAVETFPSIETRPPVETFRSIETRPLIETHPITGDRDAGRGGNGARGHDSARDGNGDATRRHDHAHHGG